MEDQYISRIWNFWDIMDRFDAQGLLLVLHEITRSEAGLLPPKIGGRGADPPSPLVIDTAVKAFELGELLFANADLQDCFKAVSAAKSQWKRPLLDVSTASTILNRLQQDIMLALQDKVFLQVVSDRIEFLDQEELFGELVSESFGSTNRDLKEAGNCLAMECNTAAVFHLMRAAEVALRAIAVDRGVNFANKPLDQQEWGTILGALEGKLKQMRLDDGKKWQHASFKESQIHFYNNAVQELRGFNEAWRRYISHADAQAFYERDEALGIMKHVRTFMQKLATRISENSVMPEYWTTV
jgi:hypothetical protein